MNTRTAIIWGALVALTTVSHANASVQQGDVIKLGNGPGSPGGIFSVTEPADATTISFGTFCVQLEEHVAYDTPYKVLSITKNTIPGNNPLGPQTAWLYTMFTDLNNTVTGLLGFNFGSPTEQQANALQLGIWQGMNYLDSYIATKTGWTSAYIASLECAYLDDWLTAYGTSGWTGTGDVYIMNLVDPNNPSSHKQDQLIRHSPEPTALLVWAGLAATLAVVKTRGKRASIAA